MGAARHDSTIVGSLLVALQRTGSQPSPDGLAHALLEAVQQHVRAQRWVALLQVGLAAQQASFWSLTSLGVLHHATAILPPDVPMQSGASGKADLSTLTGLESLPPILAQMERAGIGDRERILPKHVTPGHLQTLMVSCLATCATPLTRNEGNLTFTSPRFC